MPASLLLLASSLSLPALGGCAVSTANYPSLAPRPIENLSLAEPAAAPLPPQVADPAAIARFAPTIERARSADGDFRHVLAEERAALAAGHGAAVGSEPWAAAQVALTRIESAREPVIKALADLDAARDAGPTHEDTGEAIAAAQAFDAVQRIDSGETDALSKAWPGGAAH